MLFDAVIGKFVIAKISAETTELGWRVMWFQTGDETITEPIKVDEWMRRESVFDSLPMQCLNLYFAQMVEMVEIVGKLNEILLDDVL